jgi:SPP1 family predicted phage head-tail adaptor
MSAFSHTLDRRVSVQYQAAGRDDEGQASVAWTELRKAWVNVRGQNGLQAVKAGAVASVVQASLRTRACTDLVAGQRIVDGATTYHVLAVMPTINRRFIDLVCEVIT